MPINADDLNPETRKKLGLGDPSGKSAARRGASEKTKVICSICREVFDWSVQGDATPAKVGAHQRDTGHARYEIPL